MDPLRESVFDRSGRVESSEQGMMRVGREAAAATVNRARWIRALRMDPAELLADAASEATAAILSAERNAARRLSEEERQEVGAHAADEWISEYRRAARREAGQAILGGEDAQEAGLAAAADLAAERGEVSISRKAVDHLPAEYLQAVEPFQRGVGYAIIRLATGASAETIATAAGVRKATVERGLASKAAKRALESFPAAASAALRRRVEESCADAYRERTRQEIASESDPATVAARNGERKPHAAKLTPRPRMSGPVLPVRESKRGGGKRGPARVEAERKRAESRLSRAEWRRASALRLSAAERSLYGGGPAA